MTQLLRKPLNETLTPGVKLIHDINEPLKYVGFRLIEMERDAVYEEQLTELECCVVVLTGKVTVSEGENTFAEIGTRASIFEKIPTDSVYISGGKSFSVKGSSEKACVALCYSQATQDLPTTLIKASDNSIEMRGKYQNKRLVHNILPDTSEIASSLLVVEVYTDGGNFSSYPPHKHDQDNLPHESFLEESYYHEINPQQGFVFQRVYTDDRTLDETMAVEHRNAVVVPEGYHPVGVPDGYDSYYLNVMAGPTRIWKFHNDPDHEWILARD
ncbi:5-deoxy-glucuronate isomerase [Listeria seeligeri]|uniref:5-deoxy-glucuronate isomerase n=1 Tax=Listeria seeligeri TaxID=1640 RepID=UPI001624CA0A|nr:5-deoxy-glucuronate isomerase [Listeria seeligeri]MBC1534362.1 5-deoxy-glucuronate isomerase [Listeria seeligeri]MBC1726241.1 5-deoxy-glucuronate isomerase [Listeria seeligeri]MBC1728241.1 5-deoxy-glucuronate isomerase [Listeria seeligeri]MBC1741292.1 5-deoxy-glucuronate isomerase [Listeria seeligeri]MBC1746944.1 5-deoxy-glucuronate isomerase [Listeria seeligeri]